MPRLLFKDGCTSLTNITKTYKVGIMLTLIVISLMGDGKEVLEKAFASNGHKNCGYHLNNMQYVFAMLLAYWSWLKKYKY